MAAHIYTGSINYTTSSINSEAAAIYQFVSQYDNKITYETDTSVLTINNTFKVGIPTNSICSIKDMQGNTITSYNRRNNASTNMPITFITDNNFIYIKIIYYSGSVHRMYWVRQGMHDYVAYMDSYNSNYNIDTFNLDNPPYFVRIDNGSKNYYFPKNFNYQVLPPKILFSNTCVIYNTAMEAEAIDFLSTCSTVQADTTTVAVNNKNYYALGTNTLIEVA